MTDKERLALIKTIARNACENYASGSDAQDFALDTILDIVDFGEGEP